MADIVSNLTLRIAVIGGAEAADEVGALDVRLDAMAGSAERASVGMDSFGKALMSMKALIVGYGIYDAIKQYSDFTANMRRLQTQAGATGAEVTRQTRAIMGMAVTVGTGPNSLAQGMYHLESANFRGAIAINALKIAAEGAQIGGADLTDTVTGLTAAMLAYGDKASQVKSMMGELNAIVGAGDMTFQNLNEALGTGILGTLETLGVKLNDFGAAMAVFGDNNIRGAAAANRMRMSLMTLVHPSAVAQAAMASLHLTEYQLAEDLRRPDGLRFMLTDLHDRMEGLTKTQQAADLASIFGGGKNSAGMLILINHLDQLRTAYQRIRGGQDSFNQDWIRTQHTLAFTLHQLSTLGQVLLIKVGGALAHIVVPAAHFLIWLAKSHGFASVLRVMLIALAAAWLLNTLRIKAMLLWTGLMGVDFISAGIASLALVGSITGVADACYLLTAAIDSIPIVGWIALAIGLIILLLMHWKTVVKFFVWSFNEIKKLGGDVYKIFAGPLVTVWHAVESGARKALGWIVNAIKWIINGAKSAAREVHKIGNDAGFGGNGIASYINPVGLAQHVLGMFANGGNVNLSGGYLVGERGPEIVYLPQGSYVQPNTNVSTDPARGQSTASSTMPAGTYVLQLVVDGKILAQQVQKQGLMSQSRM